ncbi:hypothetical protein Ppro_0581 [Pelobacter propionicus DSM 2379]|uniref:Uncharacterized protein n=1 Tax=Pelobacter propionicus (strain DSM 2379 / NBRC 103807 / OttBd1) TaxID=338966 RepID=A1ALJ2_PELPD|nr:hypothetical protein Ppro_0581 [Pelobacter propionicus DSM 2379]
MQYIATTKHSILRIGALRFTSPTPYRPCPQHTPEQKTRIRSPGKAEDGNRKQTIGKRVSRHPLSAPSSRFLLFVWRSSWQ